MGIYHHLPLLSVCLWSTSRERGEYREILDSYSTNQVQFIIDHSPTEKRIIPHKDWMWIWYACSNMFSSNEYFITLAKERPLCLITCTLFRSKLLKITKYAPYFQTYILHSFRWNWSSVTMKNPVLSPVSVYRRCSRSQERQPERPFPYLHWRDGWERCRLSSVELIWIQSADSIYPEVNGQTRLLQRTESLSKGDAWLPDHVCGSAERWHYLKRAW